MPVLALPEGLYFVHGEDILLSCLPKLVQTFVKDIITATVFAQFRKKKNKKKNVVFILWRDGPGQGGGVGGETGVQSPPPPAGSLKGAFSMAVEMMMER